MADVSAPLRIPIKTSPVKIQKIANALDIWADGTLSPYLAFKKKSIYHIINATRVRKEREKSHKQNRDQLNSALHLIGAKDKILILIG